MLTPWRRPPAPAVLAALFGVLAMAGCALTAPTHPSAGPLRLVAAARPAPGRPGLSGSWVSPGASVSSVSAVRPSSACLIAWGQFGVLAGLFAVPSVSQGTNVCGPGTLRPAPVPSGCTTMVASAALQAAVDSANPGDRICTQGVLNQRLTVRRSGTAAAPVQVIGVGQATVKGITVAADHVVVAGLNSAYAVSPGVQLTGTDITFLNNTVSSPRGGDGDGIRFFGNDINILHNTVRDLRNLGGAQADCVQTYATNTSGSQHVLISSNRCAQVDNQCLVAEGPHGSAGDGSGRGESSDLTFTNNFCDTDGSQAVLVDDVQNLVVTYNAVLGGGTDAFAFTNNSTGAVVIGNAVASTIRYQVGMDESSKRGYQGPPIGGKP